MVFHWNLRTRWWNVQGSASGAVALRWVLWGMCTARQRQRCCRFAGRWVYAAGRHGGLMPPVPRHNYSLWIMKYPPAILPPESLQRIVFEGIHTPKLLIYNALASFWCPSWGFACACFYASRWYLSDIHYVKCVLVTANISMLCCCAGVWCTDNFSMWKWNDVGLRGIILRLLQDQGYLCHLFRGITPHATCPPPLSSRNRKHIPPPAACALTLCTLR